MVEFHTSLFICNSTIYIIFQCKVQCFHFLEIKIQSNEPNGKYMRER